MDEIMLSICVVSYNHEKYIQQCMDSILMQKTDFSVEVIVGNDASTDTTANKLEKYKNVVQIINRETNLGMCANLYDLFLRAKGKYVYCINGDDFLNRDSVFQTMVSFLESNSEYFSVTGWNETYKECDGSLQLCKGIDNPEELTLTSFLRTGGTQAIFAGVMRNTFYQEKSTNQYLTMGARNNEEIKVWFYMLSHGKEKVLQESVFVYRYVTEENSDNYNSTHSYKEVLEDYYGDLLILKKMFGKKYRFTPAIMARCDDMSMKMFATKKGIIDFIKVLRFRDLCIFIYYKLYRKMHHYQNPPKWSNEDYLMRR